MPKSITTIDSDLKTPKVIVSNEFIDIYVNFNILSQVDNMNKLSKKELYLLLVLCLDNHSDDDPVCISNYRPFVNEIQEIYTIQDDKDTSISELISLQQDTADKYISIDNLVDLNGDKLPSTKTKQEARDAKIGNIIK
jgi:hypothetical protein